MAYRVMFTMVLIVATQALGLACIALLGVAPDWEFYTAVFVGGAVVGLVAALAVLGVEDRRREEAFEALEQEGRRAERARVRAEFPDDLADKVEDGELSKEEARRRHRDEQRGPDDEWVPGGQQSG